MKRGITSDGRFVLFLYKVVSDMEDDEEKRKKHADGREISPIEWDRTSEGAVGGGGGGGGGGAEEEEPEKDEKSTGRLILFTFPPFRQFVLVRNGNVGVKLQICMHPPHCLKTKLN